MWERGERTRAAGRMEMPGADGRVRDGNGMFLWDLLGLWLYGDLQMEMLGPVVEIQFKA